MTAKTIKNMKIACVSGMILSLGEVFVIAASVDRHPDGFWGIMEVLVGVIIPFGIFLWFANIFCDLDGIRTPTSS